MTRSSGSVTAASETIVCGRRLEDCLIEIERFHTWKAPGLVLGLFMVDWARELIGPGIEADAIVETTHCLPDAIQLFTPCTVGNGWMKVLDWDKYALTLYDRFQQTGHRVWLDLEKTKEYPNLYNWYLRLIPKRELPLDVLLDTVVDAKRAVLSSRPVRMTRLAERNKKGETPICQGCGESYGASQGLQCTTCQGEGYYDFSS
jgi:formylmethanofuran dehydrogenase subunit E